jgi:Mg-chelatase subunit ChlD
MLHGRAYATPQDVKEIAYDVLRHRIILTYEAEAEERHQRGHHRPHPQHDSRCPDRFRGPRRAAMPIDTKELMKQVGKIRVVTNRLVDEHLSGEYHSVFKGQGIEFDEVREYVPGDDVRSIDWNVTARMGHPFVKRFAEERELTVIFLVDISGSQCLRLRLAHQGRVAAEITCLLALSAIKNQDKVGLILFSDRIEKSIPPRKGRTAAMRLVREVLAAEETRHGTDIAAALRFLNNVQKRKAVVFLISDFHGQRLRAGTARHGPAARRDLLPDFRSARETDAARRVEDLSWGEVEFVVEASPTPIRLDEDAELVMRLTTPSEMDIDFPALEGRLSGFVLGGVIRSEPVSAQGKTTRIQRVRLTPVVAEEYRLAPLAVESRHRGQSSWYATRALEFEPLAPAPDTRAQDVRGSLPPRWVPPSAWMILVWGVVVPILVIVLLVLVWLLVKSAPRCGPAALVAPRARPARVAGTPGQRSHCARPGQGFLRRAHHDRPPLHRAAARRAGAGADHRGVFAGRQPRYAFRRGGAGPAAPLSTGGRHG